MILKNTEVGFIILLTFCNVYHFHCYHFYYQGFYIKNSGNLLGMCKFLWLIYLYEYVLQIFIGLYYIK